MRTFHNTMLLSFLLITSINELLAQKCTQWSEPFLVSDSVTDNRYPTLVNIPLNGPDYYVFWHRSYENVWSEIVCVNYYSIEEPKCIFHDYGIILSPPQVIPVVASHQELDTLAFVFYLMNMSSYHDIFYSVMTNTGFSGWVRFTSTIENETHLRVDRGGGMVWQLEDKIRYSRLVKNGPGYYFEPVVTIDEGTCRNPVIYHSEIEGEIYLAWEKGSGDNPEIWYTYWNHDDDEWMTPILLFEDGNHFNIRFSKDMLYFPSGFPILVSDLVNDNGEYSISAYDFSSGEEFISGFSQSSSLQPDMFTIDLMTKNIREPSYLTFKYIEGNGSSDIFVNDYGEILPELNNYCRIDSTPQADRLPQLFEGAMHSQSFDLISVWETWRNGEWCLYSSMAQVVLGDIPEASVKKDLAVKAYPNPASTQVVFDIQMKESGDVRLVVFNSIGKQVTSRVDTPKINSNSRILWNTINVAPGIYFYRITAGNNTLTGKLIVDY